MQLFGLPTHPLVAHMPFALALVVPWVFGALLWGILRFHWSRQTWWIGVGLTALGFLAAFWALRSGMADEHLMGAGVPSVAVKEHSAHGEALMLAFLVTWALAMIPMALRKQPYVLTAYLPTLCSSLFLMGFGLRAGYSGTHLVYRHQAASVHGVNYHDRHNPVPGSENGESRETIESAELLHDLDGDSGD